MANTFLKIVDGEQRITNPVGDGYVVDVAAVDGLADLLLNPIQVDAFADYVVNETTLGGRPAGVPVEVFAKAACVIGLPTGSNRVVGSRVRVTKTGASSFAVSVDPRGANTVQKSLGTVSTSILAVPATTSQYSVEYLWSGTAWVTDFFGGRGSWIDPSQVESTGYSLLGKSATGTGNAEAIVISSNSLPLRAIANVVSTAIGENRVVGRVTQGVLASAVPNDFTFDQGTSVTKAGYWASSEFLDVASESSATLNVLLSTNGLGNGSYRFTINIVATDEASATYDLDYTLRCKRSGGTLSGAGLAAPTPDPANDAIPANISISFTNNSGAFRVIIDNETGSQWSFTISVALVYVPYPVNSGGF
jgi:hypothetical protein